jgi:phospholipid/cholesterol/gamma-HCH transport system substrate-binding protein
VCGLVLGEEPQGLVGGAEVTKVLRLIATAAVGVLLLAGCSFKGANSLPLPGGNASGPVYHVTAVFDDVQDLVPLAAVRVDDVAVGDVTSIKYDPSTGKARVRMRIKKSVHLPANAVATLEQTTLLGEKYIALGPPVNAEPEGSLADGTVIADNATSDLPDVQEVFGLLSAVLNGGDIQDLQTIDLEISKALGGREQAVRSALHQLDVFVGDLNGQRRQIVHALDELKRFSAALAAQNSTIADAIDNLGPGLKVLADEQSQFTQLLTDLSRFGKVATHIITSSREQTVAGLRDLKPILSHLQATGTNLARGLELFPTYPFPKAIGDAVPGDYTGLRLTFSADPIFCMLVPTLPISCSANVFSPLQSGGGSSSAGHRPSAKPALPSLPVPLPSLSPLVPLPGSSGGLLGRLLSPQGAGR